MSEGDWPRDKAEAWHALQAWAFGFFSGAVIVGLVWLWVSH